MSKRYWTANQSHAIRQTLETPSKTKKKKFKNEDPLQDRVKDKYLSLIKRSKNKI